jgi:hypothetical protein
MPSGIQGFSKVVGTKALPLSESAWKVRYKPVLSAHVIISRTGAEPWSLRELFLIERIARLRVNVRKKATFEKPCLVSGWLDLERRACIIVAEKT